MVRNSNVKHEPRSQTCEECFHDFHPAKNTDQGVETCVPPSRGCLETRTKESKHACRFLGSLTRVELTATGGAVVRLHRHRRQHGWTCPQLPTFLLESNTCVQFFCTRKLGYALDEQPTVFFESRRHEKRNAWICARLLF